MNKENSPQKVLLVDDDSFIRDIYSTKFSEEGVEVKTASDGKEGLELLQEQKFGAILVDIIMPGTDGLEFLERVRSENLAENASLIVLSNQGQPDDIDKAQKFHIDGYIVKASKVPSEVLDEIKEIYKESHDQ